MNLYTTFQLFPARTVELPLEHCKTQLSRGRMKSQLNDLYTVIFCLPVGIAVVTILHTTWEGSGLHNSSSIHTALELDGANPDCRHW